VIDVFARTVKQLTDDCRIEGSPGPDHLRGTPFLDIIYGRGGADTITGGEDRDRLFGGSGNDTIVSRDSYLDRVSCGPGVDRVVGDYRDRIARDCERVRLVPRRNDDG
jgi:Ca2+-binding RTX toxin-like protein